MSEVRFKEIIEETDYFRIDSEFQLHYYLNILNSLLSIKHLFFYEKIELLTDGKHGGVTLTDRGVVFLRNTNIKENIIDLSDLRFISEQESNMTKRAEFEAGDLLLTTIGTIGLCVKIPIGFPKATINQNLVRIVLKNKNEASLICAFLNSKYGRGQLLRWGAGNVYQMINYPNIKNILIPNFSGNFSKQIDALYNKSELSRKQSQSLYCQAEELLLETIGLKNFKPGEKGINVKTFKKSFLATGRLDAEYYQPKYEEIENKVKQYKDGFSFIGKQFKQNKSTIDYSEKLYNYIEIGDIDVENGSNIANMLDVIELPANAKIKSRCGDLLISKVRPNRGAVSIIDKSILNLVVSGAFTVLEEKGNYKKEVLFVLLRTFYYKEWLLKFNVGTSYPVIKDEDVLNLPIPLIEKKIQQQIVDLINESFNLHRESEKLLEEAKEMVEREIEGGTITC